MSFEIVSDSDVMKITLRGAFNSLELVKLFEAVQAREMQLARSPHRITDLSAAAGPQLTQTDIIHAVQRIRSVRYLNEHKSAIVAPSLIQYGFARMFQMLNDHPQVVVGVFRDMESAEVWLATKEEQLVSSSGLQ